MLAKCMSTTMAKIVYLKLEITNSRLNIRFSTQPHSLEIKDVNPVETDSEQNKHAYSVALASAVAAEAAAVAAQAAAEVVRLTAVTTPAPKMPVSSREELAATKIQTAFRGYLVIHLHL